MSSERYTAAVVGCGTIGRSHARTHLEHDRTDLVAVADVDPSALEAFADEFAVDATYADHEALLDSEAPDLVSVCTWHASHAAVTIDAAEAGVAGIVCEKPTCTSVGEARDVLDAAERSGAKLTVEHNRRYRPENETARELVVGGEIGEPTVALARTDDGLLNWGTHLIDHARYVPGDPETEWVIGQVERRTDRHERREPIEDRCVAQVAFSNGARLAFECDLPGPELSDHPNSLQVYGSAGHLVPGEEVTLPNEDDHREFAPEAGRAGLPAHLDDLLAWIEGDLTEHRCSGQQAHRTLEIMMAIYESLRTRGVVHTPMETRADPLELLIETGDLPVEHPGAYDIRIPYESVR